MALCLLKSGSDPMPISIVPPKNRRCRSFAIKNDASFELEKYGGPAVRIPKSDDKQCCKFMPLTFPSKRSRSVKFRNFIRSPGNDKQTADWISEVIKDIDPLVEIDPVTMARHLAAAEEGASKSSSGSSRSSLVSSSVQPLTFIFSSSPGGVPNLLLALGAVIVLVSLATAVHLFRIRKKAEERVANYESSSDEEGKLDLLSIVEDGEKAGGSSASSSSQGRQQDIRSEFNLLEQLGRVLQIGQRSRGNWQMPQIPPEFVYAAAVATLASSEEFQQAFREKDSVSRRVSGPFLSRATVGAGDLEVVEDISLERMTLEELILEEQSIAKMDHLGETTEAIGSFFSPEQQDAEEFLAGSQKAKAPLISKEEDTGVLVLQQATSGNQNTQETSDSLLEPSRTREYLELQRPSKDGVQPELPHDLTAPFTTIDDEDDPSALQRTEALIRQREIQQKIEFLALAAFVFVFSGIPRTEFDPDEDGFTDPELRQKIVQAALPAVAVGAGALSVITGVEGAFEMIGFTATASFIYYELLWAQSRRDLWQDVRSIKDHKQLTEFLKSKNIVG